MSMDPNMMSQMLMQRLMQPASGGTAGGQGGPGSGAQMQGSVSPANAAATLAQKAMLVRALQGGSTPQQMMQTHQANSMLPGTQTMMNQQLPGMTNAINPNMPPPPGLPQAPPMDHTLMPQPGIS
jgi:hypothetical protein